MAEIYGHRWTSAYGDCEGSAFRTWQDGLADVAPAYVAHALRQCVQRGDEWPPTLPEFRALCQPSPQDLGLPDLNRAYRDAVSCAAALANGGATAQFPAIVQIAVREIGSAEFRAMTPTKSLEAFARAYEILVRKVMAGEELTAPKALPAEIEPQPASPEEVRNYLAQMRAILRSKGVGA